MSFKEGNTQKASKQLVVLIDFSAYTHVLLDVAKEWAAAIPCNVLLLHQHEKVLPIMTETETKNEIVASEKAEAAAELQRLRREFFTELQQVACSVIDRPLLLELAEIESDMATQTIIFSGLKGTGLLKQLFAGSKILDIVNEIKLPVIAIPKHADSSMPTRLIVAVQAKYAIQLNQLKAMLDVMQGSVNEIDFVSILSEPKDENDILEAQENLKQAFQEDYAVTTKMLPGDDAWLQLKQYIVSLDHGMLVLQRGSRSLTDQLFRRFFINEVVYDASIPVIILPE